MPRRNDDRPTFIYWLYDMRPATLVTHPCGWPFYCGKTIEQVETRFKNHRSVARKHPNRPISRWLNACGENVRIQIIEVVPAETDWCERERFFINIIRLLYPGGANVTNGGEGAPGLVQSPEHRAKISAAHVGKKLSADHRAAMSNRIISVETRVRMSIAKSGSKRSPEVCAKISAGHRGKTKSPETRARMSAAQKGRTFSTEHTAKLIASRRGRKHSDETRAKMRASHAARKLVIS